jgi:hypothetical protein
MLTIGLPFPKLQLALFGDTAGAEFCYQAFNATVISFNHKMRRWNSSENLWAYGYYGR